jgi:prepilin-type N-terminal cleavage/methylation domain-containing protein
VITIRKNRRAGFSLIEVVIAAAILAGMIAVVFALLFSSSNEAAIQQAITHMDAQILEVMNRISQDIRNSGGSYSFLDGKGVDTATKTGDTFFNAALTGNMAFHTSLSFGVNVGFSGGTGQPILSQVRYSWRPAVGELPDNGKDDNQDGFVDEGEILREEDSPTTGKSNAVICRNVSRQGLAFQFPSPVTPPRSVTINLELMSRDHKNRLMTRRSTLSAGPRR